ISLRKMFEQIPNLLPRLCPCMLMSPISAAQYLDPAREPFDIVVFDEASQLPTCKAVGALARGKDAVIVGDPKQLPPTSFFVANTEDEDHLDEEDLESILDDCLALNMPQSHLLWHYRSRHESLIAFSNSRFYDNKLLTFPSVNDRESKVNLVSVEGVFDRGKTRTNRAEAEAIVEEIKRRYNDPELYEQSVGIVTFNVPQQHLIDDLLTEAYAEDPELERWAFDREEPLFIKNLENVQGDERDVILFSVGFGPDEKGKVYMNFGPLNRNGGWRRLNVAVSRARCEMTVFSTLSSEQLDLNRTGAEGVAALKSFLEYAEGKDRAIEESLVSAQYTAKNGVADAICNALEENGYETDQYVGRSEYRIDIGVIDPADPDKYILGIMLDGPSYGGAGTTRDRELAQINVLQGLGWRIMRVWSMDWWDNRDKELNRILTGLQNIIQGASEPEYDASEYGVIDCTEETVTEEAVVPEAVEQTAVPPVYSAAALSSRSMTADAFVEPMNQWNIRMKLQQVIDAEAPISLSLLTKRVVQSYGITRAGTRIQAHINGILDKMNLRKTLQSSTVFYWNDSQDPESYTGFRVCGDAESRRDIRDIPVQEIANAAYTVLYEQIGMGHDDLRRETAAKLGYTRVGPNMTPPLESGIAFAKTQGGITTAVNGTYTLSEEGNARAEATLRHFAQTAEPEDTEPEDNE
ncbi:MAG: DUF3320 domain-containing protein, partial [Clostridia bacterium]|nr:DUF3320 domain-containing protein [Clostridia bacterium]